MFAHLSHELKQYAVVTGNYWAFTLTDGALRMLVVLHFHQQGFSPLAIATLFLLYEFFGVVTNLVGGWLGARIGLNYTMNMGLVLQVVALLMLALPVTFITIPWVMAAQALSGVAKDLNKMSAKSAIKKLLPATAQGQLYRWIARLTGSKNALKGVGFFLGGLLLTLLGFQGAVLLMALLLAGVWLLSLKVLSKNLGKTNAKPKFSHIFSRNPAINYLSAARLFLFGARDVWFVVALPVYLATQCEWSPSEVGTLLALWVIFYGLVQTAAPKITGVQHGATARATVLWAIPLIALTACLAATLEHTSHTQLWLSVGLFVFAALFAINSSLHSYLIVRYSRAEGASLDIGFYYTANALGRLLGTLLSGWVYQRWGLASCLGVAAGFIAVAALLSSKLIGLSRRPESAH